MKHWEDGTGLTIYDGYGQTETVLLVGNYRCLPVRPGSMGKPIPGFTIGGVDEEGREVPAGEEGQIAVKVKPERPLGLFKEYWRDDEGMALRPRGPGKGGGCAPATAPARAAPMRAGRRGRCAEKARSTPG